MHSIKYAVMACAAAAALVGCYTTDRDARGGTGTSSEYQAEPAVEGLNRGVNTNYFGPVNSGLEAARGPGTPSGTTDTR